MAPGHILAKRQKTKLDSTNYSLMTNPIITAYPGKVSCDPNVRHGAVKLAIHNEIEDTQTFAILTPVEAMKLMRELAKATEVALVRGEM